jgi:hypothetical protein
VLSELERWRAATSSVATAPPSDPGFAARLRALGYAQ